MTEPDSFLDAAAARLLVEVGFLALSAGRDAEAETIFAGVSAARPGQEAGPIGLALVHLQRGHLDAAERTLRALPPTDSVQTFLGLTIARTGDRARARDILSEVAASAQGTPQAALASDLLTSIS